MISAIAGKKNTGFWDESLKSERFIEKLLQKHLFSFHCLGWALSIRKWTQTAFGFKTTMDMFILGNVVPLLKRSMSKEKNNLKAMKLSGILSTPEPHYSVIVSFSFSLLKKNK